MLKIENVSLTYGDQKVLDDISFSISKGKIVGLIGPNGAGKSSLIKILAGLIKPEQGKVFLNNKQIAFKDIRYFCGYLIDSPAYYPYLTAKKNLELINKISGRTQSIENLLKKVGLVDVEKKKVKYFSAGMKQRLALAQALLNDPKLLILDEPFNGLDPNGFQDLIVLLNELNNKGTTVFISSHLLKDLEEFASHFILLDKGEIKLDINKEELVKSKKKVTFSFQEALNKKAEDLIHSLNGVIDKKEVVLFLSPEDIASVVNKLVDLNAIPINIETHTILQEKYFEITN